MQLYRRFLEGQPRAQPWRGASPERRAEDRTIQSPRDPALERLLEHLLRESLSEIEEGMEVADSGTNFVVESGRIDITAVDRTGGIVVVAVNAGMAGQRAAAQILAHMGNLARRYGGAPRGMLIAEEFDGAARAMAATAPGLSLRTWRLSLQVGRPVGEGDVR